VVASSCEIKYDYWFLVLFSQGRVLCCGITMLVPSAWAHMIGLYILIGILFGLVTSLKPCVYEWVNMWRSATLLWVLWVLFGSFLILGFCGEAEFSFEVETGLTTRKVSYCEDRGWIQALVGLGLASLIILHVGKILLVGSDQSPKCGYEMYNNAKNSIETLLSGCCGDVADELKIKDHSVTTPRKHDDATLEVLPLDTDDDKTSVYQACFCLEPTVLQVEVHNHGDVTPPIPSELMLSSIDTKSDIETVEIEMSETFYETADIEVVSVPNNSSKEHIVHQMQEQL
jgi:hypothetical protein